MRNKNLLFLMFALTISGFVLGQSVSATYTIADIPTTFGTSHDPTCSGAAHPLTVTLPAGTWNVISVDVVYDMTSHNGAWMSEQRSRLACQESGTNEGTDYAGVGNSGTYSYSRTGLTFANGNYSGNLTFEMWAYRKYDPPGGCSTDKVKVDNGTWTVTVYYSGDCFAPVLQTETSVAANFAILGWTESGSATSWDIELGANGFSPTGTPTQSGVTNPYTYGSLNMNTTYDWYVRADCGSGEYSYWTGPATFTTTVCDQILNGDFETGDFTAWTTTGPHTSDVIQHEGSWSGHIHINSGNASNSNTPNAQWEMVGQTISICEEVKTLNFYMGASGNAWYSGGYVWIMDADSVGTYTRLFYTGGGGGTSQSYPWEFHQVNIETWAGRVVTIYFAGHNSNGYWDHQCDIYFDNVHLGGQPIVNVEVPNGEEEWTVGNLHQIQWTTAEYQATQLDSIFYSVDNGLNWTFIASHTDDPQYYDWTVPDTPSEQCLVKVVVYDDNNDSATDISDAVFTIKDGICNQIGFPIYVGGGAPSECTPKVVDIDGDGDLEVLTGGGQSLYIFHHDGTPVTGFPVYLGFVSYNAYQTPVVADIDNDGVQDIVMAGQRSELFVFNINGTIKTGWPQGFDDDDGACSSPTVADLDEDGDLEIVIGTYMDLNHNNDTIDDARVYIFHHDGTRFTGWPVDNVDSFSVPSTPAIGDIDNDGELEIIVCGRDQTQLWAWETDGTVVPGFPVSNGGINEASPTLADIDDDGDLEIFIATQAGYVRCYHHNGTVVTGWPKYMNSTANQRSSVSIGDMDGDGDLEIVCGSANGNIFAWHHNGVSLTGWPQATATNFAQGTPSIADIDGDGDMEIIAGTYSGVYAWHHDGTLLPYFPLYTYWSRSSATITDLDQDGDVEILIGSLDGNLYCWDLEATYNADNIEWNSFRNDLWNRGIYTSSNIISVNIDVFLEGPFNETDMNTDLNPNHIPLSQPYNIAPWNYTGTESIVLPIPNADIVDWVLVELRDATEAQYADGSTMIARQAAFLLNDGSIVGLDGTNSLTFDVTIENYLFAVVWHRNHLGVLSANALPWLGNVYFYNFTTGEDKAYEGADGHKELVTDIWGMIAADGNADGSVNLLDKDDVWKQQAGEKAYKSGDYNLNGQVNNPDKNDYWVPNEGSGSQVPE